MTEVSKMQGSSLPTGFGCCHKHTVLRERLLKFSRLVIVGIIPGEPESVNLASLVRRLKQIAITVAW
ncbi:hypothetical protein QQP08_014520 [Theobroma cacao]|nr:hypothetical protein QQP08_014520 [Theobroma cacao]